MMTLVSSRQAELEHLCIRHHVERLELFGSAAQEQFDPDSSDLDFIVQFQPLTPTAHADCYFRLREELESLFAHSIDLIELSPIRNPYFLESIAATRVLLYDADHSQIPV